MPLRLGIWDTPAADFLVSGLAGAGIDVELATLEPVDSLQAVQSGAADVALVPTLRVILGAEGIEVLPAVALSSWHYPYARIHLPEGLSVHPDRLSFEEERSQEALVARVVLHEHYSMKPELIPVPSVDLAVSAGARLLVGRDVPTLRLLGVVLDLGEEWFEMANYPMVWGVFVARKGEASQEIVDLLRIMVERSEALRPQWADSKDQGETIRRFFSDDVRLRFDDLAVASITELTDHAFFHDLTDEIRDFPIATLERTRDDADGRPTR